MGFRVQDLRGFGSGGKAPPDLDIDYSLCGILH